MKAAATLLSLAASTNKSSYKRAAESNIRWTLRRQNGAGLFGWAGFSEGAPPFLHTMVYVAEGLLDAHGLAGGE